MHPILYFTKTDVTSGCFSITSLIFISSVISPHVIIYTYQVNRVIDMFLIMFTIVNFGGEEKPDGVPEGEEKSNQSYLR